MMPRRLWVFRCASALALAAVIFWGGAGQRASAVDASPTGEPTADVCAPINALGGDAAAAAEAFELLVAKGSDARASAEIIIECLSAQKPAATSDDVTAEICDAAEKLNIAKKYGESIAFIEAYRAAASANAKACDDQYAAALQHAPPATANNVGDLWTSFLENVVDPLAPIAGFVGLGTLALIAAGRLLALVAFRDRPSTKRSRRTFWLAGLALAVCTPLLIAVSAICSMHGDPPALRTLETTPWPNPAVVLLLGRILLIAAGAIGAVVLLGRAFASLQQVAIRITLLDDGKGLDSTRLMAAVQGMAGSENRGIEFAVGTDITTAAESVTDLSNNKAIAALQTAVTAIFGTRPWELIVENENSDAVSIQIVRNGRLLQAKRLRLDPQGTLAQLKEPPKADLLAALVAGELLEAMRSRYASEFDPGLYGATKGRSIALQYIASSALAESAELRRTALPLLTEAVESDPQNRTAVATAANFAYRDPKTHQNASPEPHRLYEKMLRIGIGEELGRDGRTLQSLGPSPEALRDNTLLLRLVQTHAAARRNAQAADPDYTGSGEEWADIQELHVLLLDRDRHTAESPITYRRRRQALLVDQFRDTTWRPGAPLTAPACLRAAERTAWEAVEVSGYTTLGDLIRREDAALHALGDFADDPDITYSLACYRVTRWWQAGRLTEE